MAAPPLGYSGEGAATSAPDMASVRAGVETDGATAAEALAANSALAASLAAVLISWRTKNLLATIVFGMAIYWLWGAIF